MCGCSKHLWLEMGLREARLQSLCAKWLRGELLSLRLGLPDLGTQSRCVDSQAEIPPAASGALWERCVVREHLAPTLWALVLGEDGEAYGLGLGTMALAGTS